MENTIVEILKAENGQKEMGQALEQTLTQIIQEEPTGKEAVEKMKRYKQPTSDFLEQQGVTEKLDGSISEEQLELYLSRFEEAILQLSSLNRMFLLTALMHKDPINRVFAANSTPIFNQLKADSKYVNSTSDQKEKLEEAKA